MKRLTEIVVWSLFLVAALFVGCKDARELILREDELISRQREPWKYGETVTWAELEEGFPCSIMNEEALEEVEPGPEEP